MVRTPCCRAEGLKKGAWTPEEDKKLIAYVSEHGEGGWRTLPEKAGLKRCGKSCRLRWANYLRPDIKRGEFSLEDEDTIVKLHAIYRNKWSAIARKLPGRTDNEIKNYWNTHIKKKLIKKGIDPVSHEPISSDIESSRRSDKLCPEDIREEQKPPLSVSAKFLNKIANKFAKRDNQTALIEIIGGVSGGRGKKNIHDDQRHHHHHHFLDDSGCERSTSSSTTTSNLVVTPQDSSMSVFSESSISVNDDDLSRYYMVSSMDDDNIHGVSSETHDDDMELSRFLSGISYNEDLMLSESLTNSENNGYMNELSKILQGDDDGTDMMKMTMMVNDRDLCTRGAFEDIESCWDGYIDTETQFHA